MQEGKAKKIILAMALISFISAFLIFYYASLKRVASSYRSSQLAAAKAVELNKKYKNNKKVRRVFKVKESEIKARAAIVYDFAENKVLFAKNEKDILPLASITKIFLAAAAMDYLGPNTLVNITSKDLLTEGDSGLKEGTWKLDELLRYMLVVSSNDAAEAVGRVLSKKLGKSISKILSSYAQSHGFYSASFFDASGLDLSDNLSGGYANAEDVAKAASFFASKYPNIFYYTSKQFFTAKDYYGGQYTATNTNKFINKFFNTSLSKTGYTDLAGGNLVVVFEPEPGHTISIVVLGSSKEGRFEDLKKLYDASLDYINQF